MSEKRQNIFEKDIEVPPVVQEKADAAFSKIRMEGLDIMRRNTGEREVLKNKKKTNRIIKPMAAIAACAALVVAVSAAGGNTADGNQDLAASGNEETAEQEKNIFDAFSDFTLTACAAGQSAVQAGEEEGKILLTDIGMSDGGYTGMMFRIQGDGIENVILSINKGELYTATAEETTDKALESWLEAGGPDEDGNPDTHTMLMTHEPEAGADKNAPRKITLYHCAKGGKEITGKYEEETYYGFYVPDGVMTAASDRGDLATAYREALLYTFDGSDLTVTVTYTDGSTRSKEYGLSVKKLAQDENGDITQEEWTGGDEGAFVYGILAENTEAD